MDVRAGTVLGVALLFTSCASLPSALGYPRPGMVLGDLPPVAGGRPAAKGPGNGRSAVLAVPPPNSVAGSGQRSGILARQAARGAVDQVHGSISAAAGGLSKLAARATGIGGANGIFSRHVAYGSGQLSGLQGALTNSRVLVDAAVETGDADMELAVLRMAGPRLQAAMFGAILLATWVDFLNLADVVLQRFHFYSVEALFADMNRVQRLMEPSMAALVSQDPEQVEAVATAMPELMGKLTQELSSIREGVRLATVRGGQAMAAAQLVEALTTISAMKMSLARMPPPPAAPVALGPVLVMGSGGVMMGSQVVVSAEWVEMVRRLVQAGVISLPAVSAAVRIQAGQVMMAQAGGDLPQGVRDALGDGPEVRGMRETGKAGAGMSEAPRHHILPDEHRAWFERRGFKGPLDIDQFCVRLERAHHEAIHGGGNWRLGRTWPGEWNRMIMKALGDVETVTGKMLTRGEILKVVADRMRRYDIPMNFIPGRIR